MYLLRGTQTSVTAFSAKGLTQRGDTSGWTDTPQTRIDRMLKANSEAAAPSIGPTARPASVAEAVAAELGKCVVSTMTPCQRTERSFVYSG